MINTERNAAQSLDIPVDADRYTLTVAQLLDTSVQLNGAELKLGRGDTLPRLARFPCARG